MSRPFRVNIENTGDTYTNGCMRLYMENFRHIPQLSLDLPMNGVILIDGPSGIGKTTLLDAVSFVLYDKLGNSCYHRGDRNVRKKHKSTLVDLTLSLNGFNINIYRQRRSNLLRVTTDTGVLLDDVAQSYIDRLFGPYNTWLVGCMIKQERPSGFFTMNSQEKLALLQQLTLPARVDNGTGKALSGS